jgi:hypothetical protein
MVMNPDKALLLLDLDEVLVTRMTGGSGQETIVALHPDAVEQLRPFAGEVLVLTHRSRGEALQILRAVPGISDVILDIVAADDVIRASLVNGQLFSLLRKGIAKSLCIRVVERRYGIRPERIAILDDDPANVAGILENGGGMGLLAPKPQIVDGKVITFELGAALDAFRSFRDGKWFGRKRVELPASRQYLLEKAPKANIVHAGHMNRIRWMAKAMRSAFFNNK